MVNQCQKVQKQAQKTIAFFVLVFFTLLNTYRNSFAYADFPDSFASHHGTKKANPSALLGSFELPEELGIIQERFIPDGSKETLDKFVIYVQSAHANYDSESNTQKLIKFFQKEYGLNLVLLEGGAGGLDSLFFRSFPDSETKQAILNDYLKEGDLSGGEIASILNEDFDTKYFGVEDPALYRANKDAFLKAIENGNQISRKLDEIESDLNQKVETLTEHAKAFLELKRQFQNEEMDVLAYVKALSSLRKQSTDGPDKAISETASLPSVARNDGEQFRELNKLLQVEQAEKYVKTEDVNVAVTQLVKTFQNKILTRLPKHEQMEMNQMIQMHRLGHLNHAMLVKRIEDLARSQNFFFETPQALKPSVRQAQMISSIRGSRLFEELKALEDELRKTLPRSEEERVLLAQFHELEIIRNFAKLEITHKEWLDIQKITSMDRDLFKSHFDFYHLATQRDGALFQNAIREMNREKSRLTLISTGGFHSEGITERLKSEKIPYLLIAPKIARFEARDHYLKVMRDERSFMKYFQGSLWDALAKDYAAKLASSLKQDELTPFLKRWRDRIIQNSIAEGRITESGTYTRYVDALIQALRKEYAKGSPLDFEIGPDSRDSIRLWLEKELASILPSYFDRLEAVLKSRLEHLGSGLRELWKSRNFAPDTIFKVLERANTVKTSNLAAEIALIRVGEKAPVSISGKIAVDDSNVIESVANAIVEKIRSGEYTVEQVKQAQAQLAVVGLNPITGLFANQGINEPAAYKILDMVQTQNLEPKPEAIRTSTDNLRTEARGEGEAEVFRTPGFNPDVQYILDNQPKMKKAVERMAQDVLKTVASQQKTPIRWLDVGTGRAAVPLSALKYREALDLQITAMDFSEPMLQSASNAVRMQFPDQMDRVIFKQADLRDPEWLEPGEKFQVITIANVLAFYPDQNFRESFFKYLLDHLTPGGQFIVLGRTADELQTSVLGDYMARAKSYHGITIDFEDKQDSLHKTLIEKGYVNLMPRVGFQNIEVFYPARVTVGDFFPTLSEDDPDYREPFGWIYWIQAKKPALELRSEARVLGIPERIELLRTEIQKILSSQGFTATGFHILNLPGDSTILETQLNEAAVAIRQGKVIEINLKEVARNEKSYGLLRDHFTELGKNLEREFPFLYSRRGHYVIRELLKNAFVHGHQLDFELPIFLYVQHVESGRQDQVRSIHVFDLQFAGALPSSENARRAFDEGLYGLGRALRNFDKLNWRYWRNDMIMEEAVKIGTHAFVAIPWSSSINLTDLHSEARNPSHLRPLFESGEKEQRGLFWNSALASAITAVILTYQNLVGPWSETLIRLNIALFLSAAVNAFLGWVVGRPVDGLPKTTEDFLDLDTIFDLPDVGKKRNVVSDEELEELHQLAQKLYEAFQWHLQLFRTDDEIESPVHPVLKELNRIQSRTKQYLEKKEFGRAPETRDARRRLFQSIQRSRIFQREQKIKNLTEDSFIELTEDVEQFFSILHRIKVHRSEARDRRETVPREEPETVPETVPVEPKREPMPEPVPQPRREPEPEPVFPSVPESAIPDLVPVGGLESLITRSEARASLKQILQIVLVQQNKIHATPENLTLVLKKLSDSDRNIQSAALEAIPYFVQANRTAFTPENLTLVLKKLSDSDRNIQFAALKAIPYFVQANRTAFTPENLTLVLKKLSDSDTNIQSAALEAIPYFVFSNEKQLRPLLSPYRKQIEETLVGYLGFPEAFSAKAPGTNLAGLITLGAKVGAGTVEKGIAPASSNPSQLARWIIRHRNGDRIQELQVSIGFDTSRFPSQEHRGKFIALFLYIASTYLKNFQALVSSPSRDSNAAYGLLIRGDIVETKLPGQRRGKRLDYIFNLPQEMTENNLSEFLHQIQLFNLGLLLAVSEESYQLFFPGETPDWMDSRAKAIAEEYREFERNFVKLLREFDSFRDPNQIYETQRKPEYHIERQEAFSRYRLEETLYPEHRWLVPLYGTDHFWQALLPLLRTIEGMMLHQGPSVEREGQGKVISKGQEFINQTRKLGYQTVEKIKKLLLADSIPESSKQIRPDPFIDTTDEEATRYYLQKTVNALESRQLSLFDLPDPRKFLSAVSYYQITPKRSELRKTENFNVPLSPSIHRRETVPREEPETVPETVPVEPKREPMPEPVPQPRREPEPEPVFPSVPEPAIPDLVPVGFGRSETRETNPDINPDIEKELWHLVTADPASNTKGAIQTYANYQKLIEAIREGLEGNSLHRIDLQGKAVLTSGVKVNQDILFQIAKTLSPDDSPLNFKKEYVVYEWSADRQAVSIQKYQLEFLKEKVKKPQSSAKRAETRTGKGSESEGGDELPYFLFRLPEIGGAVIDKLLLEDAPRMLQFTVRQLLGRFEELKAKSPRIGSDNVWEINGAVSFLSDSDFSKNSRIKIILAPGLVEKDGQISVLSYDELADKAEIQNNPPGYSEFGLSLVRNRGRIFYRFHQLSSDNDIAVDLAHNEIIKVADMLYKILKELGRDADRFGILVGDDPAVKKQYLEEIFGTGPKTMEELTLEGEDPNFVVSLKGLAQMELSSLGDYSDLFESLLQSDRSRRSHPELRSEARAKREPDIPKTLQTGFKLKEKPEHSEVRLVDAADSLADLVRGNEINRSDVAVAVHAVVKDEATLDQLLLLAQNAYLKDRGPVSQELINRLISQSRDQMSVDQVRMVFQGVMREFKFNLEIVDFVLADQKVQEALDKITAALNRTDQIEIQAKSSQPVFGISSELADLAKALFNAVMSINRTTVVAYHLSRQEFDGIEFGSRPAVLGSLAKTAADAVGANKHIVINLVLPSSEAARMTNIRDLGKLDQVRRLQTGNTVQFVSTANPNYLKASNLQPVIVVANQPAQVASDYLLSSMKYADGSSIRLSGDLAGKLLIAALAYATLSQKTVDFLTQVDDRTLQVRSRAALEELSHLLSLMLETAREQALTAKAA